ncbi:MAG TPA: hypothetical protein VF062_28875 [Candidatus Limnocylindrales bacterium]
MLVGLSDQLSAAGLLYLELADPDAPLIPPLLATFANATPPCEVRQVAMLSMDLPDLPARANEAWMRLSREGKLFAEDDRQFHVGLDTGEVADAQTWRWVRVKLMDEWDIMGAGAAGPLGNGSCRPGFVMLSLDGKVIVRGDTWEGQIGCVLVTDPCRAEPFRQHGARTAEWRTTPPWEKAAIRRWLDTCA